MGPKRICSLHWIYNLAGRYIIRTVTILVASFAWGQNNLPPNDLVNELGCGNCHSGVDQSEIINNRAPDLSYAGVRYNEAFLFDYLKSPQKVRQHIGNSRMPDFGFSDGEALALTQYLMTRQALPKNRTLSKVKAKKNAEGLALIHNEFQCTTCHTLNELGQAKSTDLTDAAVRLQVDWIYDLILKPSAYVPRESPMPSFFSENNKADKKNIDTMIGYLKGIAESKNESLSSNLKQAKKANPGASATIGRDIFLSQNCEACHSMSGEDNWFDTHNAPNLTHQRMKTPSAWLTQYLKETPPIRPNGFFPGTGSRMPNYHLTDAEIEILSNWMGGAVSKTKLPDISDFQSNKVERLLNDFLPCLGCHELNGQGGKIGPSLSNVGKRLTDGFIKMAIEMPHMVMPESIMPKTKMDPTILPLLQSYLAQRTSNGNIQYLNLLENRPYSTKNKYIENCAACHGFNGSGNGFNAKFLPTKPGDLTDKKLMGERADDTLFDTIYVGGRIMNKSHFMPGWGEKLSREEIVNYVNQIRTFCECDPPDWSNN